jgi:hypothetical protein
MLMLLIEEESNQSEGHPSFPRVILRSKPTSQ